ncbi:MAG: hypothetical protein Q9195_001672 [Heterodermia aff. obscurata]
MTATTLWAALLVVPIAHILATSDILVVPEHSLEELPNENLVSSIISDTELSAELDFISFAADPSIPEGVAYGCTDCPFAVLDDSSDKGYKWIYGVSNELELDWSVENDVLNLNHHTLLDNEMNDLHQPQTVNQVTLEEDPEESPDTYTGELPIEYSVKVVQTRSVTWEDASILNFAGIRQGDVVQYYSVDFEILKLDDQDFRDVDVPKVNLHVVRKEDGVLALLPFESAFSKTPPLDAVPIPDFTDDGSSGTTSPQTTSIARHTATTPLSLATTTSSSTNNAGSSTAPPTSISTGTPSSTPSGTTAVNGTLQGGEKQ